MTDTRAPAAPAAAGGFLAFLVDALASLRKPGLLLPVLLLTVLLTASNILLLRNLPEGGAVSAQFVGAALLRIVGLFVLAVAILRVLNDSARPAWRPDGAFWLYGLTLLVGLGVTIAVGAAAGPRSGSWVGVLTGFAVIVVSAPFAAWFTAIAVERPLAWRAGRWVRDFGRWLPPLVLWSLLIVLPLGQLHAAIDMFLLGGAGDWFWPLALFDGPLSVVMAVFGLALASTAYRHVARG